MAFMTARARTSRNSKRPYTIAEDRLIIEGLEEGYTATQIEEELAAVGYTRTVLSLRYRIGALRKASEKYDTLEEYHRASGNSVATPRPRVAPIAPKVEPKVEEVAEDHDPELDEIEAELAALEEIDEDGLDEVGRQAEIEAYGK